MPLTLKPDPVQLVALVEFHVSVEDCPEMMAAGLAESVTVGAGLGVGVGGGGVGVGLGVGAGGGEPATRPRYLSALQPSGAAS